MPIKEIFRSTQGSLRSQLRTPALSIILSQSDRVSDKVFARVGLKDDRDPIPVLSCIWYKHDDHLILVYLQPFLFR